MPENGPSALTRMSKDRQCKMDRIIPLLPPETHHLLMERASNPNCNVYEVVQILNDQGVEISPKAVSFWMQREFHSGRYAIQLNEEMKDFKGIDSTGVLENLIHQSAINIGVMRDKVQAAVEDDSISPTELMRMLPNYEKNLIQAIESKERMLLEKVGRDHTIAGAMTIINFLKEAFKDNAVVYDAVMDVCVAGLMAIKNDRVG